MATVDPAIEHATASAVVLSDRGVLLHKHKKIGIWVGPGGHIDDGEDPTDAVLRETLEETGIVARHPESGPTIVHLDTHPANGHIHHDMRFLLMSDGEDPAPQPGESSEVGWYLLSDAIAMTDPSFARAIAAAIKLAGQTG